MTTKTKPMNEECTKDIFCGVNAVEDVDSASDLEKKHLPVITAPEKVKKGECFEVTVEVGKLKEHPNEPGHFIQFIELYSGDTFISRMDFTAGLCCPTMIACVQLEHGHGELRAFERCNLHGTWESRRPIEVTE